MRILPLIVLFSLASLALADVIVLKDGTRLEGSIKKTDAGWQVTAPDGKVTQVAGKNVKAIELGGSSGGGDGRTAVAANASLASLRRSVEAVGDINQIIERYERFIANSKDAAVTDEARKDLASWLARRDSGLVKQGGSWVTPEEAERLRQQAIATATKVRDLLRQGRVNDAENTLQQALSEDPSNAAALYLRGVMLYRQDKLVESRRSFESANQQQPDHAPTLNNLAVIVWRQNQHGAALNYLDQAMIAQPVNKFILDNVAEALGTLPADPRKGQAIQRVSRRFTEQDTLLQQQLRPHGMFRWGSQWVDQKQLDELAAAEKEIRTQLAEIEKEFEDNKRKIADMDARIAANERTMRDYEARSIGRDSEGRQIYWPLPQAYYDLKRENEHLRSEQQNLGKRFDYLRETFKRTEQQLPVPRFLGVMQLVGVEGAPLLEGTSAPPSTQPQKDHALR